MVVKQVSNYTTAQIERGQGGQQHSTLKQKRKQFRLAGALWGTLENGIRHCCSGGQGPNVSICEYSCCFRRQIKKLLGTSRPVAKVTEQVTRALREYWGQGRGVTAPAMWQVSCSRTASRDVLEPVLSISYLDWLSLPPLQPRFTPRNTRHLSPSSPGDHSFMKKVHSLLCLCRLL